MPSFIKGLELSRRFYEDIVAPIFNSHYPTLRYAAGRIGAGSDVLGFDTQMSTDHGWGPTVDVFVSDADAHLCDKIYGTMRQELPLSFMGYPVGMTVATESASAVMQSGTTDNHRVRTMTVRDFAQATIGINIDQSLDVADWLSIPQQRLLGATSGAVFVDNVGELTALRERLAWYPRDVWLYMLVAGWTRIGQDEHLMPRAGYVGDELGSRVIASRLVRTIMQLCFLMERRYAPYPKWLGSAFTQLDCADQMQPILVAIHDAQDWQSRMDWMCMAYEALVEQHNRLGITPALSPERRQFHDRPFYVSASGDVIKAIRAQILDEDVLRLLGQPVIGSIDQFSDSTDLRENVRLHHAVRRLYEA